MEIVGVRVELPSNTPIVLLREVAGRHRMLPIFIGGPEATAIALALDEVRTPRPMTHDLIKNILDAQGMTFSRLEITELSDGTFYSEIHLGPTDGAASAADGAASAADEASSAADAGASSTADGGARPADGGAGARAHELVISSRPSDGIALAIRMGAPIFAAESVVEEAGQQAEDEEERDDVVEQFREFIDSVDPEDFAS